VDAVRGFSAIYGRRKHVTQLDDKRLHWEAEIGGKNKEWNAKITEQIPDLRIAWQSEGGENTSGIVSFSQTDRLGRVSIWNSFMIRRVSSNRLATRLESFHVVWNVILSASKNSLNSAGAKPVHGAPHQRIRVNHSEP